MLKVQSNIGEVFGGYVSKLESINKPQGEYRDKFMRAISLGALAELRVRVHKDGLNTNLAPIGTYSNKYLKVRQSKFNRTSDRKVIFSLTRNMENDLTVIADGDNYAIGFNNPDNFNKAQWLQDGTTATSVKAHTRNLVARRKEQLKKKKPKSNIINVKAHNRKGWKGFGDVYKLSDREVEKLRLAADDIITELFG